MKVEGSCEEDKLVKISLSKVLNETYLAISADSQCIYFRNYMKRIVRIILFRHSNELHYLLSQHHCLWLRLRNNLIFWLVCVRVPLWRLMRLKLINGWNMKE